MIKINGVTVESSCRSVVISKGRVIVDGKDVTPDSKDIRIVVSGDIEELRADCCDYISVAGNVKSIKTQSGDVAITGDVAGSVQTMSGDVNCGMVKGSIATMSGDIKHKRS